MNEILYEKLSDSEITILFSSLHLAPKEFWIAGDKRILNSSNVLGVVGPRKISKYQQSAVEGFEKHLRHYDCVLISGGAEGTDMVAHQIALKTKTPTIVVLGCGIKKAFQSKKRNFLKRVVDDGGVVCSEFSPNQQGAYRTYPKRNRIITFLSDVLFIPGVESGGGTEYSYRYACKQKKRIYVLPGHLGEIGFSLSNQGIVEGKCILLHSYEQCLRFFKKKNMFFDVKIDEERLLLNDSEKKIVMILKEKGGAVSFDEFLQKSNISIHMLLASISKLIINGVINEIASGSYQYNSLSGVNDTLR